MKAITGEQQLVKILLEEYIGRIKGTQPMIQRSMGIAYEAGVRDALLWVRKYNESMTVKPKVLEGV